MRKTKTKTTNHSSSAIARLQKSFPNVKEVVDATEDTDIVVTKGDTTTKAVRNHKECALAQACRRVFAAEGAVINVTSAYIIQGKTAYRYKLPESVSREIVSFDREAGFEPGTYHLHTPPPSSRLGVAARTGSRAGYKKGNGRPYKSYHFTDKVRRVTDLNP